MLGIRELIMILGVAMLLFGANKLPELARSMGSSVGEFKRAQMESERNLREFGKPLSQPTAAKSKIQETAEKLGFDIEGKTDDQLLDEMHKSVEKPKEVS